MLHFENCLHFLTFAVTDVPTTLPPPTTTKVDQGKEEFNDNIKNQFYKPANALLANCLQK